MEHHWRTCSREQRSYYMHSNIPGDEMTFGAATNFEPATEQQLIECAQLIAPAQDYVQEYCDHSAHQQMPSFSSTEGTLADFQTNTNFQLAGHSTSSEATQEVTNFGNTQSWTTTSETTNLVHGHECDICSASTALADFDAPQANSYVETGDFLEEAFNQHVLADAPTTCQLATIPSAQPYAEILEQPAFWSPKFRYRCELRNAGSIPGINSTPDNKTYPTIRVNNLTGPALVFVSCVTGDEPYRSHPHNLVGRETCEMGVCSFYLNKNSPIRSLKGLGIECTKRKDIEGSLSRREALGVDPFKRGYAHKRDPTSIDLNIVRLCFQVFVEGSAPQKFDRLLASIVSDRICNKKNMSNLVITRLSHFSAPASGGCEVILLTEKIDANDVQVRFFEKRDDQVVWETVVEVTPDNVHKQVAIFFKTPQYQNGLKGTNAMVWMQLQRRSDKMVGEPKKFQFLASESDDEALARKRRKVEIYCHPNGPLVHYCHSQNCPHGYDGQINATSQMSHPFHGSQYQN